MRSPPRCLEGQMYHDAGRPRHTSAYTAGVHSRRVRLLGRGMRCSRSGRLAGSDGQRADLDGLGDAAARLTSAGATIRDVRPVTLERAARALISTGRHALADTSTEFQPLDPSGEKNGDWAPSVPGNGVAWSWSRSRNISREFSSASPM
jgi:hypothetical protein